MKVGEFLSAQFTFSHITRVEIRKIGVNACVLYSEDSDRVLQFILPPLKNLEIYRWSVERGYVLILFVETNKSRQDFINETVGRFVNKNV